MKRRTVSCLVSAAAVLVCVSVAVAGPGPGYGPGLIPGLIGAPVGVLGTGVLCDIAQAGAATSAGGGCGEAELISGVFGNGIDAQINVDWMVLELSGTGTARDTAWAGVFGETNLGTDTTVSTLCPMGTTCYAYLYQEENTNTPGGLVETSPGSGKFVPSGVNMISLSVGAITTSATKLTVVAGVFGANKGDTYTANKADDLDCGEGNPAFKAGTCFSYDPALHPGHYIAPLTTLDTPKQATNTNPAGEEEGVCPAGDSFGDGGDPSGVIPVGGDPTGSGTCINPLDPIVTAFAGSTVFWTYTPSKPPHHETVTLFYVTTTPPVYGGGSTSGGSVGAGSPTTWATLQCDPDVVPFNCFPPTNPLGMQGEPVPVSLQQATAIPEPTTLLMFGGGLVALGLLRRKVKRSSVNPS